MIVAESDDGVRCISQPDHAALAGRFAERWGNEEFDGPEPRTEAIVAAYTHDDGWFGYDRRPHRHDDGTPVDFYEVPADAWIDLYDDGIESVVDLDPYAGLLVSLHGSGLRRRRYGLSPSWPDTPAEFEAFVEREEERQSRLVADLRADDRRDRVSAEDVALLSALHDSGEAPAGTDSRLWYSYRLLQAWDTLSLAFCTTLSPPGYDEIDAVPAGVSGSEETLTIEALGDGSFRIEPYPFDASPLSASVPARTVPADAFEDDASLVRAYYGSERETVSFSLRRDDR